MCTKTGFRGVYYASDELRIEGEFDSYVREDLDEVFLRLHRCKHCGAATHWTPLSEPPYERMGVNARLGSRLTLDVGYRGRFAEAADSHVGAVTLRLPF